MMSKEDLMELIDLSKLTNLLGNVKKKEIVVKEKKECCWKQVLCIVAVIAAIAGVAYAVYRYFNRDLEDEFMDDFEDWDDDELFDEDETNNEEDVTFEEE